MGSDNRRLPVQSHYSEANARLLSIYYNYICNTTQLYFTGCIVKKHQRCIAFYVLCVVLTSSTLTHMYSYSAVHYA